jgi:DNA helicase-2/ATP-dependent DNA helicase PcrA
MDFLAGLNPEQQRAAAHVEGPLLILAGAGSGKTRVITHRICHLITTQRAYPSGIVAVTFTNKAAGEMRERIGRMLSSRDVPQLTTFHSFCVRLLRRDGAPLAQLRPNFSTTFNIYDEDDQLTLIKQAFKHIGVDEKFMQYRAALSRISAAKNQQKSASDIAKEADPKAQRLAVIFERYQDGLIRAKALDFDDLLLETVRLLKADEMTRQLFNRRIEFLMIDEYQDTNRCQYDLMRLLSAQRRNVAVVGDEDQSIYSWRGADIRNILDFERDYPDAAVIRLEQNYRSTKNILDAAGAVVANNKARKGKWLWTDSGSGELIGRFEGRDGEHEALFIADTIERILRQDARTKVAILYRTNFQSRQIEEALRRYNRRYNVVGGFSFYQRAEVKDILSYLKAIQSPADSVSLLRILNVPARGIGKTTTDQIEAYAGQYALSVNAAIAQMRDRGELPARAAASLQAFLRMMEEFRSLVPATAVHELIQNVLERTGYIRMLETEDSVEAQARIENIHELVNAAAEAAERGETLDVFLDHAALVSDADQLDEQAPVTLLTIHNAKGLEWPVVFVSGMEEGLFPHQRSLASDDAMEEERRLCYVAMTRAQKTLFLTNARYRRRFGGGPPEAQLPSRFLTEVPRGLLRTLSDGTDIEQVELMAEEWEVREAVKRNLYTGKTYNSVENIANFFAERGMPVPAGLSRPKPTPAREAVAPVPEPRRSPPPQSPPPPPAPPPPQARTASAAPVSAASVSAAARPSSTAGKPPAAKPPGKLQVGATIQHPKFGRGTILRREGEGEDAKLTISFAGHGLKKIYEKFLGI